MLIINCLSKMANTPAGEKETSLLPKILKLIES